MSYGVDEFNAAGNRGADTEEKSEADEFNDAAKGVAAEPVADDGFTAFVS